MRSDFSLNSCRVCFTLKRSEDPLRIRWMTVSSSRGFQWEKVLIHGATATFLRKCYSNIDSSTSR